MAMVSQDMIMIMPKTMTRTTPCRDLSVGEDIQWGDIKIERALRFGSASVKVDNDTTRSFVFVSATGVGSIFEFPLFVVG